MTTQGTDRNLGDPADCCENNIAIRGTIRERRGLGDDRQEVGLVHSRGVAG